jgi:hypothetical protein
MPMFDESNINHGGELLYTSNCDQLIYNSPDFLKNRAKYLIGKTKDLVNSIYDITDNYPELTDKGDKIVDFMNSLPLGKVLLLPNCNCDWQKASILVSNKKFDDLYNILNNDYKKISKWIKSPDFISYYNSFNGDLKRIANYTINRDLSLDIQK